MYLDEYQKNPRSLCQPITICNTSNPCLNGGLCIPGAFSTFSCDCLAANSGPICEVKPERSTSASSSLVIGAAVGAVGGVLLLALIIVLVLRFKRSSDDLFGLPATEIDPARVNIAEVIFQTFTGTVYAGELKV
jgi:hypothetical protein